jgi:hypothetical protein
MRKTSPHSPVRGRPSVPRRERLAALLRTANTLLGQAGPSKALLGGLAEQWHVDYQDYLAASSPAYPLRALKLPLRSPSHTMPVPRRQGRLRSGTRASRSPTT